MSYQAITNSNKTISAFYACFLFRKKTKKVAGLCWFYDAEQTSLNAVTLLPRPLRTASASTLVMSTDFQCTQRFDIPLSKHSAQN